MAEQGLTYGSICSGIEAATVAWSPLSWRAAWFAEIDPFCCALLAHHYPDVPNLGDFTMIGPEYGPIDVLVGGTPCQSFSVAGRRGGLDDPRGDLALEFLRLAGRLRPRWVLWENVPGILSSSGGRDFGTFLGALGQLGYGWAYRVLDAQYFGLAQRRRRVFVVGHSGGWWQRAAAVLFERQCLSGDSAASGKKGTVAAGEVARSLGNVGGGHALNGSRPVGRMEADVETLLPVPFDTTQITSAGNYSHPKPGDPCHPLSEAGQPPAVGLLADQVDVHAATVRRLTPRECERLQGFPDDYTLIPYRGKPASDSKRYRALGNSFAVPVVRWIGERIAAVEAMS